ncbi:hypothetical protein [Proteiniphilum propionicum]|uniref:hypothetical protein n=1 Tax=Proteiniphilum propionicum TaxID=2829812 RepID=UPI001EEAD76F|nr:hypothetical protein [Proteiniphilum propionicum]ULB35485.1 hypothetical protein KDN43_05465 [Proteiniphilum propionicum]
MNRLCSPELEWSKGKTAERSDVFFPCGETRREPQRVERGWWKEGARSMRAPDAYCPQQGWRTFCSEASETGNC